MNGTKNVSNELITVWCLGDQIWFSHICGSAWVSWAIREEIVGDMEGQKAINAFMPDCTDKNFQKENFSLA